MQRSIDAVQEYFGDVDIVISAQAHLDRFYTSLGFRQISDIYLEDDIPHIKMKRDH
jgi:ElaA protein